MELNKGYNDEHFCDLNSILNYIKNNWIKILLLIVSFFIIYIVDYINNINYRLIETSINATAMPLIKMTKKSKKSKK